MSKEITNLAMVVGELIDITNVKEDSWKDGTEYFKYNILLETNPETGETMEVEFNANKYDRNGNISIKYKGMDTIYEQARSRVTDGEGDIIRATGSLVMNSYVSKKTGEIINKLVIKGNNMTRQKGNEKDKSKFIPGATFSGIMMVDSIEKIDDETTKFNMLINEYKSAKSIRGHIIPVYAIGKDAVEGTSHFEKDMLIPGGAIIEKHLKETVFPDKMKEWELLDETGCWGTEKERIIKENERRKVENEKIAKMKEEGIKIYENRVVLTGTRKNLTEEDVENKELPFETDDIDEMLELIDEKMEDLENESIRIKEAELIGDDVVPF